MSGNYVSDHRIEEMLQEEEEIEGEVASEIEDNLEVDDYNSDSCQSGEDDVLEHRPSAPIVVAQDVLQRRPDLSDLPLKYIRQGHFIGRNGETQWSITEPPANVRTRSHNIIVHLPGPINEAKNAVTPLDCWSLMFPDYLLAQVVTFTNMYIVSLQSKFQRERDCLPTDLTEVKSLFGLLYYCGRLRGAHLNTKDLWAADGTGADIFISTMSRQRFHFLLRCLRFDDMNTREDRKQNDKLAPIRELFTEFVEIIKKYYSVGDTVTIDEKLEPFRGRCPFRQYMPNKPAKYGIKIFVMTDSRTYYTTRMEVYTGKQNPGPFNISNSPADVVKRMVEQIRGTHRNVVMDNWFNSFPLMTELFENYGLTIVGTLRKNKPEIPPIFIASRGREEKTSYFGFQPNCTLLSYTPKKGKVVLLASTMHHDAKINPDTGDKLKPEIITDYNMHKCGVDVVDEMCGTYSVSRISKRWPLTLFFGLMNVGAINAYVIYNANMICLQTQTIVRRTFLKDLALSLIKPQIEKRSSITSLPRHIRNRMFQILGGEEGTPPPLEPTSGVRGRCSICPYRKDRKTKTQCQYCQTYICREHTKFVCDNCNQRQERD